MYLGFKIQKANLEIRIRILRIPYVPIFRQNGQLWLFGPKFAQKWILGSEFQKPKCVFGINTSNILCVPIFSQKGQLLIFRSKFREIAQLRAIFWFKYCWGCCRELGGDWNELGGGGWSWVELGARFSNTQISSKVITEHLKKTLPFLISSNQSGNVFGQFISEGGRLIFEILQISHSLKINGLLATKAALKRFF